MDEIVLWIFLISGGVQFGYLTFFAFKIFTFKCDTPSSHTPEEGLSIIVCAWNELDNLKKLLAKLYKQDQFELEIIVVNDRSSDGSHEFLLDEKKSNPQLKVVTVEQTPDHIDGKKYAITLGIKAAKNDRLLFTDADCCPSSTKWATSISNQFSEDKEFILGFSQFEKSKGSINAFSRFETIMVAMQFFSYALAGKPYMGVGRNLAYRKSMFLGSNGFHGFQRVTGGDDDLLVNKYANAKNTGICMGTDALVFTQSKKTFGSYFQQKLRHLSVSKHYKLSDKLLLGIYSSSYLLFWIAFVILAIYNTRPEITYSVLVIRIILSTSLLSGISKKLGERIDSWTIPILDLVYGIYLLVMGPAMLITKKVKWR